MDELSILVNRIKQQSQLKQKNQHLEQQLQTKYNFTSIIGESSSMQKLFSLMNKVKDLTTLILIRGESGTGKELVAKALHFQSVRKKEPFLPVNCAGIPENLLESEFFGHKKVSFTGADNDKEGYCSAVGQGTLFLDEMGELSMDMQAKLLRLLQEKEYTPVGTHKPLTFKGRIICATHVHLEEAVETKDFREDLFHRLNVFPLYVPPLSERKQDIPILVKYFLKKFSKAPKELTADAMNKLTQYTWPGNVRELENNLERACILAEDAVIQVEDLTINPTHNQSVPNTLSIPKEGLSLDEIERNYILAALESANGNKTKAAEMLGITRRSIYSKMKTHGLV